MVEYMERDGESFEEQMLALRHQHELALQDLMLEAENQQALAKYQRELDYLDSHNARVDAQLAQADNLIDQRRYGEALYELEFRGLMPIEQARGLEEVRRHLRRAYTGMSFGLLRAGAYQDVVDVLLPLEEETLLWHPSYYCLAVACRMTNQLDMAQRAISQAIRGCQEQPTYFLEASRIWLEFALTRARLACLYIEQRNSLGATAAKEKLGQAQEHVLESLIAAFNVVSEETRSDLKTNIGDISCRLATATSAIHAIPTKYQEWVKFFN